jgi:hypothetical protein
MLRRTLFTLAALSVLTVSAYAQGLTIDRPGVYVLNRNISVATGDGIVITASNVTLDLGGRTVSTTASGTGRGIVVSNAKAVTVKNGKVGAFNMNVLLDTVENVTVDGLQITGAGLAPSGGPVEIGFAIIGSRAGVIQNNVVSSVNLGLIIRGSASVGNKIFRNQFVGGATAANNLLGICWNPLAGAPSTDPGPVGDFIYLNQISGFRTGASATSGSRALIFRENAISYFNAAFSGTSFAAGTGNIDDGNTATQIL